MASAIGATRRRSMTIMCMLASAVWGGSSSSAAICSNAPGS